MIGDGDGSIVRNILLVGIGKVETRGRLIGPGIEAIQTVVSLRWKVISQPSESVSFSMKDELTE